MSGEQIRAWSFLKRIGSDSTKPFKSGDNSHLAQTHYDTDYSCDTVASLLVAASENEKLRAELVLQVAAIDKALAQLKIEMADRQPREDFFYKKARKDRLVAEKIKAQALLAEVRLERTALHEARVSILPNSNNYTELFFKAARALLPKDVFQDVCNAVEKLQPGARYGKEKSK